MAYVIQVKFEGIDSWNRPVFKSTTSNARYGSVDILFSYGTSEEKVLEKIDEPELLYFGTVFNCEPMGNAPRHKMEIIRPEKEEDPWIEIGDDENLPEFYVPVWAVYNGGVYIARMVGQSYTPVRHIWQDLKTSAIDQMRPTHWKQLRLPKPPEDK